MKNEYLLPLILAFAFVAQKGHAEELKCIVIGDSIAQGIAAYLPDCDSNTKVGLNTKDALTRFSQVPASKTAVVSLGVNDGEIPSFPNLKAIRSRIKAQKVIWILPAVVDKKWAVKTVARENGDITLNVDSRISSDKIHPTMSGYKAIAVEVQKYTS